MRILTLTWYIGSKVMKRIGFIGLGSIGAPMARSVIRAGFDVTVCDKFPGPLKPFQADGVKAVHQYNDKCRQMWR